MTNKQKGAAAVAVVASVALVTLLWQNAGREPGWTSRSPEALEEALAGLEDLERNYWSDAEVHFERALELDPEMPLAKLNLALLYPYGDSRRERFWEELRTLPKDEWSDRERFLVAYWSARNQKQPAEAQDVLESYMADQENGDVDPFGLKVLCDDRWERQRWDEAEACYHRLLALQPNWAEAQSRLGLMAMAQGRFEDADESFRVFRYIAPEQASPYDSLGQLQAVLGQYESAEESFRAALEIKPDYCMTLMHLERLYLMWGRYEQAAEAVARMQDATDSCDYFKKWGLTCSARAWNAYLTGDQERASEIFRDGCLESRGGFDLLAHRLAILDGDFESAEAIEAVLEQRKKDQPEETFQGRKSYLESLILHLHGVRSFAAGDLAEACEAFDRSDELGLYWGLQRASFKLYNQKHLVRCYERSGHPAAAGRVRAQIQAVNPRAFEGEWLEDITP